MKVIGIVLILFFIFSAQYITAAEKTYTNKDVEKLKRVSPSKKYKSTRKRKTAPSIPGLPIEKREVRRNREPVIKYTPSKQGFSLTVIGTPSPNKKPLTSQNKEIDLSIPSFLNVKELFLPADKWQEEYEEYFDVHYGVSDLTLTAPQLIAVRSLKIQSFAEIDFLYRHGSMYDEGDDGLMFNHLSSHFVVDSGGVIYQTMPLDRKTKGAFGVEYSAVTIELTGTSVEGFNINSAQKQALENLLVVLAKKFGISPDKIYSTSEIALGKTRVPEYLDNGDSDYPDRYSPAKSSFGPSAAYMDIMRKNIKNLLSPSKNNR